MSCGALFPQPAHDTTDSSRSALHVHASPAPRTPPRLQREHSLPDAFRRHSANGTAPLIMMKKGSDSVVCGLLRPAANCITPVVWRVTVRANGELGVVVTFTDEGLTVQIADGTTDGQISVIEPMKPGFG